MTNCPKAKEPSPFDGHRMRLEKSDGYREVWRCALGCGHTKIENRIMRCGGCGGFKIEAAPWWCPRKAEHE